MQDVDPLDVDFGVVLPDEILRKGWMPVLAYLRELRLQGGGAVREARVFLLGEGVQGKTSLMRALLDQRNVTDRIELDDRTVGIDVQVCSGPEQQGSEHRSRVELRLVEGGDNKAMLMTVPCVLRQLYSWTEILWII